MKIKKEDILIAYFSHRGENYFGGKLIEISKGNTEKVAEYIYEKTGGTLFEIKRVEDYPNDYQDCTVEASKEFKSGYRPQLQNYIDISSYKVVFLGFPCWWGTMPMPVWTFLESTSFEGKTIVPFCTNEGSHLGDSVRDIVKLAPKAKIVNPIPLTGSAVDHVKEIVDEWVINTLKEIK